MKGARPPRGFLWQHPAHFYALGFGAGLVPFAPGTFGTLMAFPIAYGLWRYGNEIMFGAMVLLLGALGVLAAERTGRDLAAADHGAIVCDELVAFLAILLYTGPDTRAMWIGFLLFRLFDIIKPPPIRQLDRHWKNGVGVMVDDLVAALYAIALLVIWDRFRP